MSTGVTGFFELSCGFPPGPDFADLVVLAEELGYARAWVFDSAPCGRTPSSTLPSPRGGRPPSASAAPSWSPASGR